MLTDENAHDVEQQKERRRFGLAVGLFAVFLFVAPIVAKWMGWL